MSLRRNGEKSSSSGMANEASASKKGEEEGTRVMKAYAMINVEI
jgi:hypothetical protein